MGQAGPRTFYDTSSQRYTAGDEFAAGGEGSIHEVRGEPGRVMKLYSFRGQRLTTERRGQLQELRQKVKFMIAHAPVAPAGLLDSREHHYWTWPIERLFTRDGGFSGYVMPMLTGEKGEEFVQLGSGHSWKARLVAARNLAKLIATTHQAGYIVGDLNPRNLFFTPIEGAVSQRDRSRADEPIVLPSITDTDSFQIGGLDGGAILFPCRVQNPEYSAPELIDAEILDRTVEQDYFCLAIVIFQLLSLGLHPYSGTTKGSINQEIRTNIARGRNVLFSDETELTPPRLMIDLEVLPPEVHQLFERTFHKGDTVTRARASAEEWEAVLDLVVTEGLHTCEVRPNHYYGAHLPECPWCHYIERVGGDPFNLRSAVRPGQPQAPREIEAAIADSGVVGSPRVKSVTGRMTAPPTADRGSDTHFGPLPSDLAPDSGQEPEREAVPEVTLPRPEEPKREPVPDDNGAAEPPSEPRWRRLLSSTTVLIVLIVIVFGLAFAFRGPLQQFWVSRVQPVIPNPFDRAGTEELMPFELPPLSDACQGSCSLLIKICVDTDAPFDCTGVTGPAKPNFLALTGPDGNFVNSLETLSYNDGSGTTYLRFAQALRAGSYQVDIDDSNLRANYTLCNVSPPDVSPPAGGTVSVDLASNRTIAFVYCAR